MLAVGAEVHQYLVLNAAGGVGGQPTRLGPEGLHRLDESQRADGHQVVLLHPVLGVLLGDVGHQPQVVLDQRVGRGPVPGEHRRDQALLLGLVQRFWKG